MNVFLRIGHFISISHECSHPPYRSHRAGKNWHKDVLKNPVWEKIYACEHKTWEIKPGQRCLHCQSTSSIFFFDSPFSVAEKPEKRSWAKHFVAMYCEEHDICIHCWQKGRSGHRSAALRGMRPLCTWLTSINAG